MNVDDILIKHENNQNHKKKTVELQIKNNVI